jgi:hypothetical protein
MPFYRLLCQQYTLSHRHTSSEESIRSGRPSQSLLGVFYKIKGKWTHSLHTRISFIKETILGFSGTAFPVLEESPADFECKSIDILLAYLQNRQAIGCFLGVQLWCHFCHRQWNSTNVLLSSANRFSRIKMFTARIYLQIWVNAAHVES